MPPRSPRPNVSARMTPFRPRTPLEEEGTAPSSMQAAIGQCTTPRSASSLPRRHYLAAAPSPAASHIKNCEEDDGSVSDGSIISSGPLSNASTHGSAASGSSGSGNGDKENGGPAKYSPTCLKDIKSRLARNKLRRESDSLRSILSSASKDRDAYAEEINAAASKSGKRVAGEMGPAGSNMHGSKKYKVNLSPRINCGGATNSNVKKENAAPNLARHRTESTGATTTSTAVNRFRDSATNQPNEQYARTTDSTQQRTEKCLWNALQIMQSRSQDSGCSQVRGGSTCGSSCSTKSDASSAMFVRLRTSMGSFSSRSRTENRNSSFSDVGSQASSRAGSAASVWLRRSKAKSDSGCSSSTFSVSPIAKEANSIVVGSVRLDSKGDERSKELEAKYDKDAVTQLGEGLAAVPSKEAQQEEGAEKEPISVGSTYIGSLHLEGKEDASSQTSSLSDASALAAAQKPPSRDCAKQEGKEEEDSETSGIRSNESFPPSMIDDVCFIEQVPSDMTQDNKRKESIGSAHWEEEAEDVLTPLPPPQSQRLCAASPAPSAAANSCAPSYATSVATGATDGTESTNLFDMLRNTFNHGSGDDSSDDDDDASCSRGDTIGRMENVPRQQAIPASPSRPPLSPIPVMGARQSRVCSKPQRGRSAGVKSKSKPAGRAKPVGTTPNAMMSPIILRGTPCMTPRSDASSSFFHGSSVVDENSPNTNTTEDTPGSPRNQLEYSFLASALCATNVLATPVKSAKKKANDGEPKGKKKGAVKTGLAADTLNYASIGATTSSHWKASMPRQVDPMALALEAESICSPIEKSNAPSRNGFVSRNGQNAPPGPGTGIEMHTDTQKPVAKDDILSIASALDDASSLGSQRGDEAENLNSMEDEFDDHTNRESVIEGPLPHANNAIEDYLDEKPCQSTAPVIADASEPNPKESSSQDKMRQHETIKLRERVKWLEKVLGFGRGANSVFEGEIRDLKEKVEILERRLEEEMVLKEEAMQRALELTTDAEAAQDAHKSVEECLRQKIVSLEADLESKRQEDDQKAIHGGSTEESTRQRIESLECQLEDVKREKAEDDAAAKEKIQQALKDTNAETEELRRTNEGMLKRQRKVEKELVSCAEDNDELRRQLLSIANDQSVKEQTLATALAQLKSLSESHNHTKRSLAREKETRRDEVSSLQWSLDDASRQMTKASEQVNKLQAENESLREELRRVRLEKMRSTAFHRATRGG